MRAAMAAALDERTMLGVVNLRWLGEALDRLRQQVREVGDLDLGRDLWLGLLRRVNNMRLVLGQRPFKTLLGAVHVEALAILPRDVIQKAPDVRGDVAVLDLDMAGLD